ncbi:myb-like protein D [Bolinopsis microptera]|uniref:myb-like protein D n=1 Tax=Bolinopsis microptera TaxID=2820187 RepID=UPI00307AABF9
MEQDETMERLAEMELSLANEIESAKKAREESEEMKNLLTEQLAMVRDDVERKIDEIQENIEVNKESIGVNKGNIEINKESIGVNKGNIEINNENVEVNKESIEVNKGNIEINNENVEVNKESIEVIKGNIEINNENVEVNKESIGVNKGNIEINKESIEIIKGNIEINNENVEVNKESIGVNKGNIEINKESIGVNKGNIEINNENVEVNKESIGVNKGNIEINKESIGVNKGNIEINNENVEVNKESIGVNKGNIEANNENIKQVISDATLLKNGMTSMQDDVASMKKEEANRVTRNELIALETKVMRTEATIRDSNSAIRRDMNNKPSPVIILSSEETKPEGNPKCARVCAGTSRPRTEAETVWVRVSSHKIKLIVDISLCGFFKVPTITTSIGGKKSHGYELGVGTAFYLHNKSFVVYLHSDQGWDIDAQEAKKWLWNVRWIAVGYTC